MSARRSELIERTEVIGGELRVLERALGPRWVSALAWGVNIGSASPLRSASPAGSPRSASPVPASRSAGWPALGIDQINKRPLHERLWLLRDELKTIKRELARLDAELGESPA